MSEHGFKRFEDHGLTTHRREFFIVAQLLALNTVKVGIVVVNRTVRWATCGIRELLRAGGLPNVT